MEDLPIDKFLSIISHEPDPNIAFQKIINLSKETLPSGIWDSFFVMNINADIIPAKEWIQKALTNFPETTGIYLGLDTLNMENGLGSNSEIGLSSNCNPEELSSDWTYECDHYAENHLIKGLSDISNVFQKEEQYTSDERSFAEYLVFLGYSGIVFREALLKVKYKNDFLAIWGFHDGDMFYLANQLSGKKKIVASEEF